MTDFTPFLGTWTADAGPPFSSHTFTWELEDSRLHGRWIVEAPDSPAARAAAEEGRPLRIEMRLDAPTLEDGVLLFQLNGVPFVTEFRLIGDSKAVVGAAVDKLSPQFAEQHMRAIEGHRVCLSRQSK